MANTKQKKTNSKGVENTRARNEVKLKTSQLKSPAKTPMKRVTRSKRPIATTNNEPSDQVLMKEAPQLVENLQNSSQGKTSAESEDFEDSNNNATVTNPVVGSAKSLINAIKGRRHKIVDNNKQENVAHKDPFYVERPQPQCSTE